jgi:ankyrin repeat protein
MLSPSNSEQQLDQHLHHQPQRNRSLWDELPLEIKDKILKNTDPLTQFLNGLMTPAALRFCGEKNSDERPLISIWKTAFETNYSGDLRFLPAFRAKKFVLPDPSSLHYVKSREMYDRLCQFQPSRHTIGENTLFKFNRYWAERFSKGEAERLTLSFVHIPIRNCWYDMIEGMSSQYPIACARIALKYGHMTYFRYLIDTHGVEPRRLVSTYEAADMFTTHPLQYSCLAGDFELSKFLCEDLGISVDPKCVNNASASGNVECVRYLLRKAPECFTKTAMDMAAKRGNLEVAKILYEDAHLVDIRRAVENALWGGHAAVLRYLLSKSPETVDRSTVIWALRQEYHQALLNYIEYGAIEYDSATVTAIAVVYPDTTALQTVIQKKPELVHHYTWRLLCAMGRIDVIRLIHERFPHIKVTPPILHNACYKKHFDVVKYLVESIHLDDSVKSLIQAAIPHFGMVRYLHTNTNCICYPAAFSAALSHGRMDIFNYLRTQFPEVSLDSSAFYWAAINNDVELFNYLRDNCSNDGISLEFCEAAILNQNFEMIEFGLIQCYTSYRCILGFAAKELDWEPFRKVFDIFETVHQVKEGHSWNCKLGGIFQSRNTKLVGFVLTLSDDSKMFEEAARIGDLALMEFLSTHCSRDFSPGYRAFEIACVKGHLEVVKYLLDRYPNQCNVSWGLKSACLEGYPSVISFLTPLVSKEDAQKAQEWSSNLRYFLTFLESKSTK